MSEKLPNKTLQIINEDFKLQNQQDLQLKEDEIVRKIWKAYGEKGLLVFMPLLIGISYGGYVGSNKTEIDKVQNIACSYHEDPVIRRKQYVENGSPDCYKEPSSELIGNSLLFGLSGTILASGISLGILASSRKLAKYKVERDSKKV